MSTASENNGRRRVVVTPVYANAGSVPWMKIVPVWIASAVVNLTIVGLAYVLFSFLGKIQAGAPEELDQSVQTTQIEEQQKDDADLTQTDVGTESGTPYGADLDRQGEDTVVPGLVDMTQAIGVEGAPTDAPRDNVPLPPGTGDGMGGALKDLNNSLSEGGLSNLIGGKGGSNLGQQFAGRSGGAKERMLNQFGGNKDSEAAVAEGLQWLAQHQAQDGHWSLTKFNEDGRDQPRPSGKLFRCSCQPGYSGEPYKVAATAFGLLPFLGAGITHNTTKTTDKNYRKTVEGAVHWLMNQQNNRDGRYSSNMYEHGIATIAMCEAYGLTKDPRLLASAQKGLNFIAYAQDPAGGGWRYSPKEAGDTSVTGWQLMALKSGQMAGLSVSPKVLKQADRFLSSVESSSKDSPDDKGGRFAYVGGQGPTPTMTAVGLLCRIYGGDGPKNPAIRSGVKLLKANSPDKQPNIYYLYYATQVMHQVEGDAWKFWNEGVDENNKKVHKGIRDILLSTRDKGTGSQFHQKGSWSGSQGGRLMATSLSLLCLEVYYRHLPLYHRDISTGKEKK
jgi:hypothetical protein